MKRNTFALGYALFIYIIMMVLIVTLIPFRFRVPEKIFVLWAGSVADVIENIALFLPIGFLYRLLRRESDSGLGGRELRFGLLLSLTIELAQIFLDGRYTSVSDVLTNGAGAWIGAYIYRRVTTIIHEQRVVTLFALELPLMNIVYFLIPLVWLNGLAAEGELARLWLLPVVGVFATGVMVSIYAHRLHDTSAVSAAHIVVFSVAWFLFSSIPALVKYPQAWPYIGMTSVIITAATMLRLRFLPVLRRGERRFEVATLKRLLPLYLCYLALLALWTPAADFGKWHFTFHLYGLDDYALTFQYRFIEMVAAFTLLGYMLAEMRGRTEESAAHALTMVFFLSVSAALVFQVLRGFHPSDSFNLLGVMILTLAGSYGAVIYRLQLAAIRQLKSRPVSARFYGQIRAFQG